MHLAIDNGKQSSNDRLSRLRSQKASTMGHRLILAVIKPFDVRIRKPIGAMVPSGIVKAGDCETTNLHSNLLIANRVRRRVDTPIRNRVFIDGDLTRGRTRMLQPGARVQYGTRYANIVDHQFMPPTARTMIIPRFVAQEARARR